MNLSWEVRPASTEVWAEIWAWLKQQVFALAFRLLVSLVVSAALAGAARLGPGADAPELPPGACRLARGPHPRLCPALSVCVDTEIGWCDVWLGGVMTAGLFTLGKTASVGSAYDAAGSMVGLLGWVYDSALIVFFGAEDTQAWATPQGGVALSHAVSGAGPQTKDEAAAERTPGA